MKIYGTPTCPFCDNAKDLLDALGIHYTYFDITKDEDAFQLLKFNGLKTVPQIWDENGDHIGGFDELRKVLA